MPSIEPVKQQIEKLVSFRDSADIPAFNRNLRNVMLEYTASKKYYDFDRGDFLIDMVKLFDLLDVLEIVNKP